MSSSDKLERDAARMKSRSFGGYAADRVLGRADFSKAKSGGDARGETALERREREAGLTQKYAKGGYVMTPKSRKC